MSGDKQFPIRPFQSVQPCKEASHITLDTRSKNEPNVT